MEGFIILHRKIMENWIWQKPEYFQWFTYFLFRANFKNKKILLGSELIELQRGQFVTSINNLVKDLPKATPQKIRTFLKLLKNDAIINIETTTKLTKITICKYDSYQSQQQTNNKRITNEQQTSNKRATTENNVNKVNNENNVNNVKEESKNKIFAEIEKIKNNFSIELNNKIDEYLIYRKKTLKKPIKDFKRFYSGIQKNLKEFSEIEIINSLEISINMEYQGYFPKKNGNNVKFIKEKTPLIHDTDY